MNIFNGPLNVLENALDIRAERQTTLAANAANIDTPGYVAQDVDFDASLALAMDSGDDDSHDSLVRVAAPGLSGSGPGSTVDLDRTMAALAENALAYGANARVASKHLALLRTVVNDGVG